MFGGLAGASNAEVKERPPGRCPVNREGGEATGTRVCTEELPRQNSRCKDPGVGPCLARLGNHRGGCGAGTGERSG